MKLKSIQFARLATTSRKPMDHALELMMGVVPIMRWGRMPIQVLSLLLGCGLELRDLTPIDLMMLLGAM
ncbi:hypothetical protein TNCV_5031561 [Trichonephila clavipes]|nr:hypothetical protein TNCV_5031561 [Trichonephila clavipes]